MFASKHTENSPNIKRQYLEREAVLYAMSAGGRMPEDCAQSAAPDSTSLAVPVTSLDIAEFEH